MNRTRSRIASALLLTAAGAVGWLVAGGHPPEVRAGGAAIRAGESSAVAGPIRIEAGGTIQFGAGKMQAALDAVYWLDYRGARLYAAIPSAQRGGDDRSRARQVVDRALNRPGPASAGADVALLREFASRDLLADFRLPPGTVPHFLLNTASLGGTSQGTSILVVVETATRQVAAYQAAARPNTLDPKPDFALLQVGSYGPAATGARGGDAIATSGPFVIQQSPDGLLAPLDVVYWVDFDGPDRRGPRLHATMPTLIQAGGRAQALVGVGERDLAKDFGLPSGSDPQFVLASGSLGVAVQGASALWVVEMKSKKVAVYRPAPETTVGGASKVDLELIEVKSFLDQPPPALPSGG